MSLSCLEPNSGFHCFLEVSPSLDTSESPVSQLRLTTRTGLAQPQGLCACYSVPQFGAWTLTGFWSLFRGGTALLQFLVQSAAHSCPSVLSAMGRHSKSHPVRLVPPTPRARRHPAACGPLLGPGAGQACRTWHSHFLPEHGPALRLCGGVDSSSSRSRRSGPCPHRKPTTFAHFR